MSFLLSLKFADLLECLYPTFRSPCKWSHVDSAGPCHHEISKHLGPRKQWYEQRLCWTITWDRISHREAHSITYGQLTGGQKLIERESMWFNSCYNQILQCKPMLFLLTAVWWVFWKIISKCYSTPPFLYRRRSQHVQGRKRSSRYRDCRIQSTPLWNGVVPHYQ